MPHFFTDVHVVADDKTAAINALPPASLYVEDAAHHVDAALAHCDIEQIALISRPWNKTYLPPHPRIRRIITLTDLHAT